jgi:Sulfatase
MTRWLSVATALLLVNFAPSFHNVWPTPWITARAELSVEAAVVVLLLVLVARRRRVPPALTSLLALVLLLLAVARYMEVTAPALYGRAINLYWDAQHLPAVAAMLADAFSRWQLAIVALTGCGLVLGIYFALRWALRTLTSAVAARRALGIASASLIAAYTIGYYASIPWILRWFSIPVTQTYTRQIEFVAEALAGSGMSAELPAADPLAALSAPRRSATDVLVIFVESYGAVAYDADSVATVLAPHREAFAAAVADARGELASAFVTSPTFGGVSWLAHASLMTGIDVTESAAYDVLLTQERETLADRFAAAGYRTLALMPGLRGDWPEGSFYGFDRIYGERSLEYAGPAFGWWRVPDQYALARLDHAEIDVSGRAPVFVFFPTISTHLPFRPTPPYQPDWQALSGPAPYGGVLPTDGGSEAPDLMNLRPAYAGALAYTYDYLAAYVGKLAQRDYVLLILGDHQPAASVAGEGARWDVPVHVIASDAAVLDPFLAAGFVAGIEPRPKSIGRTHELGPVLLEALGAVRVGE